MANKKKLDFSNDIYLKEYRRQLDALDKERYAKDSEYTKKLNLAQKLCDEVYYYQTSFPDCKGYNFDERQLAWQKQLKKKDGIINRKDETIEELNQIIDTLKKKVEILSKKDIDSKQPKTISKSSEEKEIQIVDDEHI